MFRSCPLGCYFAEISTFATLGPNSIPERLILPTPMMQRLGSAPLVVQTVTFAESNAFAAPVHDTVRLFNELPVLLQGCIQLVQRDDTVAAMLANYAPYVPAFPPDTFREHPGRPRLATGAAPLEPVIITDYTQMGAPGRSVPLYPLVLQRGEWGQLRYLGRQAVTWDYTKYVYNIGWLWEAPPRIFIDTHPHHRYDSMPNVW